MKGLIYIDLILDLLFIFLLFSVVDWIIEFVFKSIRKKRLINPGFMVGITLPIYGFGGVILYAIWSITITNILWLDIILLSFISMVLLTGIEFIGGFIAIKYYNNRLWDYSKYKYNYKGLICPLFSLLWFSFAILFYFLIMPWLPSVLIVLKNDVWLAFVLGFSYGLFIIDLAYSLDLMNKIKRYAKELNQTLNFQIIKDDAYTYNKTLETRYKKFKPYVKSHINNELSIINTKKNH
jgi:uncharacterized membrane protein